MKTFPRLLFLSGTQDFSDLATFESVLRTLLDAGLPWFQFRDKILPDRDLFLLADRIRQWTRDSGCLLTINDRPDIALLCGADGVHLGIEDLSALETEFKKPNDTFHLGISTHSASEVRRTLLVRPDYLGVGPVHATLTKVSGISPRGPLAIAETRALTGLPLVAIGGMTPENAPELLMAGADIVAVSSAISRADSPVAALNLFLGIVSGH
jgi:thiamine-phosphate pyrophosphorylase